MRSEWTWARIDLQPNGVGRLLCQGSTVVRLWLPPDKEADLRLRHFLLYSELDVSEGGAAEKVAKRISSIIRKGGDLSAIDFRFPECAPFTRRVLELCRKIPPGQTMTYGELASRAGNPKASRAVGQAMATNVIPLLIPCHRVVNSNPRVVRYGGGPEMKLWLLRREGALAG